MTQLIREIIGADPFDFAWLDEERAIIESKPKIGIYVDYFELELKTRKVNLANISFGTFNEIFYNGDRLNTELTGVGQPRKVFSTIANAILSNKDIVNSDLICLAASDEHRQKRSVLYSLAIAEIQINNSDFKSRNNIRIKLENGTIVSLLSKTNFSEEEKEFLEKELKLEKIL